MAIPYTTGGGVYEGLTSGIPDAMELYREYISQQGKKKLLTPDEFDKSPISSLYNNSYSLYLTAYTKAKEAPSREELYGKAKAGKLDYEIMPATTKSYKASKTSRIPERTKSETGTKLHTDIYGNVTETIAGQGVKRGIGGEAIPQTAEQFTEVAGLRLASPSAKLMVKTAEQKLVTGERQVQETEMSEQLRRLSDEQLVSLRKRTDLSRAEKAAVVSEEQRRKQLMLPTKREISAEAEERKGKTEKRRAEAEDKTASHEQEQKYALEIKEAIGKNQILKEDAKGMWNVIKIKQKATESKKQYDDRRQKTFEDEMKEMEKKAELKADATSKKQNLTAQLAMWKARKKQVEIRSEYLLKVGGTDERKQRHALDLVDEWMDENPYPTGTSQTKTTQEGKTAINNKTGKRMMSRNGKWEKI